MDARVALVTGGGRGIGGAISLELARRGCDVAVQAALEALALTSPRRTAATASG